jgi:hypothetical protein
MKASDIIREEHDNSHLGPYDSGSADSYYGRRYDPHKYVDQPDGSRKRVKLTDPKEIAAYKAGYSQETGRKDYGESVEEAKNKGLYANVHAKRERIKHGSGEHMRKSGEKGRPTAQAWKDSAKTAESESLDEIKQRLDAKCWTGKHKEGTKIKGGVRVNNCVPNESVAEASSAAQQAAIAIAKKKSGKYDKEGKRIREDDDLNRVMDIRNKMNAATEPAEKSRLQQQHDLITSTFNRIPPTSFPATDVKPDDKDSNSKPEDLSSSKKNLGKIVEAEPAQHKGQKYDPELARYKKFAQAHFPTLDPEAAFDKLLQRSMQHGEQDDDRQDRDLKQLHQEVAALQAEISDVRRRIDMKK